MATPTNMTTRRKPLSRLTFEIYEDAADEWRWRLRAGNGEPIADSGEGYKRLQDCLKAVRIVRGIGPVVIKKIPKPSPAARVARSR